MERMIKKIAIQMDTANSNGYKINKRTTCSTVLQTKDWKLQVQKKWTLLMI